MIMNNSIINTHSHVYDEAFDTDRDEVMQRARDLNVTKIILPDIDAASRSRMFETAAKYPDMCFPMLGIHPTSVNEKFETELDLFFEELPKHSIVGIGEIGIDLYWDKTFLEQQEVVFSKQMSVALERNLPVVIHVRKSFNETYNALRALRAKEFKGIFHCFSGSKEEAFKAIEMGFHIGIGGVLTFKTSHLDEIVQAIPRERIVIETDDPYLSPVPHRGKRNEPGYVTLIAEKLAHDLGMSTGEVVDFTTENASHIFSF